MTKRIGEDWKRFRDVISGRTRKKLRELIKSGAIVKNRGKNGKITISIPRIDIPHIVFGDNKRGLKRGPGKEGDVIGRDPVKGDGQGQKAGEEHAEGITISLDMEDVLKFMKDELQLPELKPKPNQTYDEVQKKYNDISKIGPESLRHTRRTMQEALKRAAMTGQLGKPKKFSGSEVPMEMITLINSDRRYRQYKEIKIPSSNAVIFFARDCSASMSAYHCEVVSDMSWWLDAWIRQYYSKVERCYFIHDTLAEEVDEEKFYRYRQGGGTKVSSVFEAIAHQLENRFSPDAYNIYIFYFTDGDNWGDDNQHLINVIKEKLPNKIVNLIGISQILPHSSTDSVKSHIDNSIRTGVLPKDGIVTVQIGKENSGGYGFMMPPNIEDRDIQIIEGVKRLLGKQKTEN